LAVRERAVSPDHPDTATSTNNLAAFYQASGRPDDALPLVQRLIASGRAELRAALPVLADAQRQQLIPAGKAVDDMLNAIQRGTQSSAASAVNKLAVRLAAGSDRLAELVRRDQDLAAEAEALDKSIVAAVSKDRSKRDAAAEQRARARLAAIATERASLQRILAAEFPDYAALSNPLPMTAKEIQSLLSGDEAMVLFAVSGRKATSLRSRARTSTGSRSRVARKRCRRTSRPSAAGWMSPISATHPASPDCSISRWRMICMRRCWVRSRR
jgi:hypothetical protein